MKNDDLLWIIKNNLDKIDISKIDDLDISKELEETEDNNDIFGTEDPEEVESTPLLYFEFFFIAGTRNLEVRANAATKPNYPSSVVIPEYVSNLMYSYPVVKIMENGFTNIRNLRDIVIPRTIVTIDNRSFADCRNLTRITVKATKPPKLGNDVFKNIAANFVIVVPQGTAQAYKQAAGWKDYKNHITEFGSPIDPDNPDIPDTPDVKVPEFAENNGMVTVNVPTIVDSKDVTVNNFTVFIKNSNDNTDIDDIDDFDNDEIDDDDNKLVESEGWWSDEY